jgi:SWI/SNF-related matrix-associated actin-dependent regulator of chromatin subfamily A3
VNPHRETEQRVDHLAHVIRNRSTKQYRAISAIPSQHRWCLTGTPIQNSLEDLGSLVSFIRVPILEDPAIFRKYIVLPPNRTPSKDSFSNLCLLLGSICIRRTNRVLGTLEPIITLRKLHLSEREIEQYSCITEDCKRVMLIAISTKKGYQAKHVLLQTFLKLRLFCNNGQSDRNVHGQNLLRTDSEEALSLLQQQDKAQCVYCSCDIFSINGPKGSNTATLTDCYYLVCEGCQSHHLSERRKARNSDIKCCHLCYKRTLENGSAETEPLVTITAPDSETKSNCLTQEVPTKLKALLGDIIEYRAAGKRYSQPNGGLKLPYADFFSSIVFSFWKTTLNIVAELLDKHGLQHCRIHGSMTLTERRKVLAEFRTSQSTSILLMTLGTGAVG